MDKKKFVWGFSPGHPIPSAAKFIHAETFHFENKPPITFLYYEISKAEMDSIFSEAKKAEAGLKIMDGVPPTIH